jgi:iron complex outermembrane recepter protein
LQSPFPMLQDFMDIERVEVLRGPQGTLDGRNAVGGSINIITKAPTYTVDGDIGVEYGNYNQRKILGDLGGPLAEGLRGRFAFALDKRDGFFENVDDPGDNKLENLDYYNLRATLDYDVTQNVLASVTGYFYRNDGANYAYSPCSFTVAQLAPPSLYADLPPGFKSVSCQDVYKVQHDTRGSGFDKMQGVTGNVGWTLGDDVTLRSISGYFDMTNRNIYDGDGLDFPSTQVVTSISQEYKTFSEELQLSSSDQDRFRWVAGAYYYHEDSNSAILVDYTKSIQPLYVNVGYDPPGIVHSRSLAAFGQGDFKVTDKLILTAGLRYTYDKMDVSRSATITYFGTPLFSFANVPDEASWKKPTWKLGVEYHVTPDAMWYLSYSRGYRSGGFNLQDTNPAFAPETLDAYETGIKSEWLDRHLQVNGSIYYYNYNNKQEVEQDATGISFYTNAGKATIKGAELELVARATDQFSFDASASYLDAKYKDFSTADPEYPTLGVEDLAGRYVPYSPKVQVHVGPQYEQNLAPGLGSVTVRVDYSYTDQSFVRPFNMPTDLLPAYHRTNASLQWHSDNRRWFAELYGKNLENKAVLSSFSETGPFNGNVHQNAYLDPRTYGIKLRYHFGM